MRSNLKQERILKGMTQKEVADHLGISVWKYNRIEKGSCMGSYAIWDKLEILFETSQAILRSDPDYSLLNVVHMAVFKLWVAALIFKIGVDIWVAFIR